MILLPFSRIARDAVSLLPGRFESAPSLVHEPDQKDLLRERKAVCLAGRRPELTLLTK